MCSNINDYEAKCNFEHACVYTYVFAVNELLFLSKIYSDINGVWVRLRSQISHHNKKK